MMVAQDRPEPVHLATSIVSFWSLVRRCAGVGFAFASLGARSAAAQAFDAFHEGAAARVALRSDQVFAASLKADAAILPFPAGPEYWGGPINGTRLEARVIKAWDQASLPALEQGRFAVLHWPHARALAVTRDTRMGTALGGELFGAYVPYPLHGSLGMPTYGFISFGGDLGYRHQRGRDGSRRAGDGHYGASTVTTRVDDQSMLSPRVALRSSFDVSYTFLVGSHDDSRRVAFSHALVLEVRSALTVDLSAGLPYREVPRVDPVTGEHYTRAALSQGKRLRLHALEASFELRPFNTASVAPSIASIGVGLSHEY